MEEWPSCFAMDSGVRTACRIRRPIDLRSFLQQQPAWMWPTTQVMNSGVAPCFWARSTAAPLSSSSRAASTWPPLQAQTAAYPLFRIELQAPGLHP